MIRNFNSSFISAQDKRASKSGAYGLHKHFLERMRGNFKSVIHEQIAGGKSLRFDGTDDFAQTSSVSLVAKTISLWFKADSTINASSSRECLLGFGTAEQGIYLGGENSQLTNEIIQITDGYGSWGYESASASISSSAWHHICCVWETSNSSTNSGNPGYDIYLNATKVGNGFGNYGLYGNRNYITTETVKQGAFARPSGGVPCFYDGLQDEVAIWNVSLSAADITSIYNAGAPNDLTESASYDTDRTGGLIGYWRNGDGTENGSGTTIHDMSSNSNNMTLTNGPTYSDSMPTFASTLSASFDGTNDFLLMGTSAIALDTNFTISAWIKPTSAALAGYDFIGGWGNAASGQTRAMQILNSKLSFEIYFSRVSGSTDLSADTWHHAAITFSGNNVEIFLNGSSDGTGSLSRSTMTASETFIGGTSTMTSEGFVPFAGLIDEFAVFDSVLSASNITAIYNSGAPADLSSYSPVGWWRMGENDSGSNGATIGTVTDQGSGGNNATGTNGPTYSDTVPS